MSNLAQYINTDTVVSNAQLALGLKEDSDRAVFREWAYEALRSIGFINRINVKTECEDINDLSAPVPCDMIKPISMRIKDSNGNFCNLPAYSTNSFKENCDTGTGSNTRNSKEYVSVEQQGNRFIFSSRMSNSFNIMEIKYYAYPVDEAGYPLIPEYYGRAIQAYIEYSYIKRERSMRRKEIPMSEVDWHKKNWLGLRIDAVGVKNMPSELEADEVIRSWQTLLPNQRKLNPNSIGNFYFSGYIG